MRWLATCCGVVLLAVSLAVYVHAGTVTGQVTASGVKDARDTVVYLDGIEAVEFLAPATPAELRQINKAFIPHVLPIVKGGSVRFSNSDGILHNVHLYQGRRSLFNLATPAGAAPITKTFHEPGEVAVLCDVHPEMSAYIIVLETPYAATTDEQGHYELVGIPEGTYTLKTWHEKLTPASMTVTVHGEQPALVNVELK